MNYRRALTICKGNPCGAFRELLARLRLFNAPKSGVFTRTLQSGGATFTFDLGLGPLVCAMYAEAYETFVVSLIRRILDPGDTFVDIGANIGYLSAIAASCVGPTGSVLSFEPNPEVFCLLEKTRSQNPQYKGWQAFQCGLGRDPGEETLVVSNRNMGWSSLVPGNIPPEAQKHHVKVPIETLDRLLQSRPAGRIKLAKIDVEGYESLVLEGMEDTLRANQIENLIVEICPPQWQALGRSLGQTLERLKSYGFEVLDSQSLLRLPSLESLPNWLPDIWLRRRPN